MSLNAKAMWLTIGGLAAVDAAWLFAAGFTLTVSSLLAAAAVLAPFGLIALFYHLSGRSRTLSALAHALLITFAFFVAIGPFSYLAAASGGPLIDPQLARLDRMLGLDWLAWFEWTEARPWLTKVLALIYGTSGVSFLFCIVLLTLTGRHRANNRLLWSVIIALIVIVPLSAMFPAESAWLHYGVQDRVDAYHAAHFEALRSGRLRELDLMQMTGLVTFPSFHTALAILVAASVRESRRAFAGLAPLNALVVLSVPTAGGHHFVDVLAGAAAAVLALALATRFEQVLNSSNELVAARRSSLATSAPPKI